MKFATLLVLASTLLLIDGIEASKRRALRPRQRRAKGSAPQEPPTLGLPEEDYLPSSSFSPTVLGLDDPKTPRYLIAECFGSGGFPCSYYQSAAACLSLNHPSDFTVVWAQNANEGMRVGKGTCQAGTNDSNKIVDVADININNNSKDYVMFCCSGSQYVDPGIVSPPE